ncbi:MAG: class I SAM-dependent methyltransferase [Patescibacteria group bacterium]|jgi:SAM-dependent methyltransferase
MKKLNFTRKPVGYTGEVVSIPCFLSKTPPSQHHPTTFRFLNRTPSLKRVLKGSAWPIVKPITNWRDTLIYLFVDGYIARRVGHLIKRHIKDGKILEVGIGNGRLLKYFDLDKCDYYAFDIYDTSPLANDHKINLFVASATDIPLPDSSIDAIVSTEVFEHIPNFKKALSEMHRVCKNGAKMIISIPNNFAYKYQVKGKHPEHVNEWHYSELIGELSPKFKLIEGSMRGYWLPILKKWRYSLQIPCHRKNESLNSNFFYVFECVKEDKK